MVLLIITNFAVSPISESREQAGLTTNEDPIEDTELEEHFIFLNDGKHTIPIYERNYGDDIALYETNFYTDGKLTYRTKLVDSSMSFQLSIKDLTTIEFKTICEPAKSYKLVQKNNAIELEPI